MLGFALGAVVGFGLSLLVVHVPSLDRGLMPWVVASQTVPIVALAPMIVVILNQAHVTGLLPKAVIAAYLSFFPVAVGMVKGLRSPDPLQLDLMRTYSASPRQTLSKLRLPASLPFCFASLKIGVAASLVGTVVAEVTKSEDGGLGARLLAGSYYGQTVQIWAALIVAAICGAVLVGLMSGIEVFVMRRTGPRDEPGPGTRYWVGCGAVWLLAWVLVEVIIRRAPRRGWTGRVAAAAVPLIFGATLLFWWEMIVRGSTCLPSSCRRLPRSRLVSSRRRVCWRRISSRP